MAYSLTKTQLTVDSLFVTRWLSALFNKLCKYGDNAIGSKVHVDQGCKFFPTVLFMQISFF